MKLLDKLLATEVQTKQLSDVDVKKLRKKLAKNGINLSEEDIKSRIQEFEQAYEFRKETRSKNIAFIISILSLVILAIQEELFKANIITMTTLDRILAGGMGVIVIATTWACCLLHIKKKPKFALISLIVGMILEIAMALTMIFL